MARLTVRRESAAELEKGAPMEQTTLGKAASEDDLVYRWRLNEALAAGYSGGAADRIARDTAVELELTRKLARLGCPEDLALAILL
jgi:hypothetical protein